MERAHYAREYTRKEKLANWLHYNKLWLVIGAVVLWILGTMLWNALGIGRAKPDVCVAYVGSERLTEDTVHAVEEAIAAAGEDLNGDGRVTVRLSQHITTASRDAEGMLYGYAAEVTVLADITDGESYLFLMDDPESFQKSFQILARLDGSMPEETDFGAMDKVYTFDAVPALAAVEAEQRELLSGLYLGRRYYYDPAEEENLPLLEALWDSLTEGAGV